jgi:hypothetical protein
MDLKTGTELLWWAECEAKKEISWKKMKEMSSVKWLEAVAQPGQLRLARLLLWIPTPNKSLHLFCAMRAHQVSLPTTIIPNCSHICRQRSTAQFLTLLGAQRKAAAML